MNDKKPPVLVIISDHEKGKTFQLTKNVHFCGRALNNDIQIDDISVSSVHCKFVLTGAGSYMAIDLDSTNGILLGGKVLPYVELKNGDIFKLGNTQFLYSDEPSTVGIIENTYVDTYFVKNKEKS
ncbi:MAG TPA: hypothetical protein DD381_02325 [Lentisphaeria bacterium]|nr:MAG: hypothetical protein A2X47_08710 [Lentisphaerae bacterium GWF2_38_69]HBM15173.1 hypothetical protein [Lentisphaeria bacterium]